MDFEEEVDYLEGEIESGGDLLGRVALAVHAEGLRAFGHVQRAGAEGCEGCSSRARRRAASDSTDSRSARTEP